ncbi:hypothetical protein [Melittangium boletus]|uniref:Uncharacterized protein n=1 Tax=Melittangium boletus DSM 14713 TaxID=1294270 RepID=A0A250IJX3_9BACT|nr:hypothetical protein [Melittangium boletus]ATB31226.1 hypothetical protein MEBOL_004688 [Melittangium boletus DSM 14713]
MVKLALLGDTYASQLRVNPRALVDMEVVWVGESHDTFRADVPRLKPDVLALDFADLGQVPPRLVPELMELTGARHALVSYRLTNHALLESLTSPRVRFVQGPLPLSLLRVHVNRTLQEPRQTDPTFGAPRGPKPPRFTPDQLGRLMELATRDTCECSQQLARLVSGLRGFEEYSDGCDRPDEKELRLHGLLHRQVAFAREALEDGLVALLEHQNIRV